MDYEISLKDIRQVISTISLEFESLIKDKGIIFEVKGNNLSSDIMCDGHKIGQVVRNCISNAVKFTPAGGTVTIKAANEFAGGFSIQIIDTGIGLSQDDIPKAMAPFGQIDSSLSRNFDGTGLGLPLSKSFIELQGGSLELESAVDVGTTVTIRFPEKCVMLPDIEERSTVA